MDSLARIFELQKQFNKQVGCDVDEILSDLTYEGESEFAISTRALAARKQVEWLKQFQRCIAQENSEFLDSLPWKHWKKMPFDKQNAKVEVIDILHFLISCALLLGMDEKDFLRVYEEKMLVNKKRQENGYTSETKDPNDCSHIQ